MSMIKKKPPSREDVNYWRSMVDIVLGILLVVLLAMSLLMLGLMDQPLLEEAGEYYEVEPSPTATPWAGGLWSEPPAPTPTLTPSPTPAPEGDGGGGDDGGDWGSPSPMPTTTPGFADDEKSAVLVSIRDVDTEQILPIEGIGFEVLDDANRRLSYDVYYPEHISYTLFETTDEGVFYLPEKLEPGEYTLENINAPQDYDLMDDVEFEVEKGHNWDDPVLVYAYMAPSMRSIRLEIRDADTGLPVPGGLYSLVPTADVTTSDGTVRYRADAAVESVGCDETGEAEMGPLFLGTFRIVQTEIPFGYARADTWLPVTLTKGRTDQVVRLTMQRTTVKISVRDELTLARVAGMPFALTDAAGQTAEITADGNGEIVLVSLEKNADYSFTMTEAVNGYRLSDAVYSFHVDEDGLVEGEAVHEIAVDAHMIRCRFGAASAVFSRPIAGHDMGLFRTDGTVVEQWYSAEEPWLIEGLEPGSYVLTVDGKEMPVQVIDTADRQTFYIRIWETQDIVALAVGGAMAAGIMAGALVFLLRRKKRASSGDSAAERKTRVRIQK